MATYNTYAPRTEKVLKRDDTVIDLNDYRGAFPPGSAETLAGKLQVTADMVGLLMAIHEELELIRQLLADASE